MYVITIDTGTTNTRVSIWKDNDIIAQSFQPVGVRDTAISGSKITLINGVKAAIDDAMKQANITYSDPLTLLSSGMITSNVGLHELAHQIAPAGITELAQGMVKVDMPDVAGQPIWFVPGVRNNSNAVSAENVEAMDVMRGEETEVIGVIHSLGLQGPALIILPGSHSKFICIDEKNCITGCVTTMGGELLDVITQNTILASSLEHGFADEIDSVALLQGSRTCQQVGLSRSCFSVRILDMFANQSKNQKANFLLGAVLSSDIYAIKNSNALNITPDTTIVIGGKKNLKEAFTTLIQDDAFFTGRIHAIDESPKPLSGIGIMELARARQLL
ncbi:2-dehydro-3-deoxygalactonokinase [Yersinia intermedia]|uniref:2-dehydro-3-deoxygalactonokinase n=1 Tax=Yersinia intermedia TaxID=631 RepID=UPI0022FE0554|nr:2-dehydro-3-deoxygalactonokinase [Yersinia intermedia]MDA5483052.1 2-dehydro-3-deoxygalactonokinase [Yersinia intermedia]